MISPSRRFALTALFLVAFVFANAGVAHALVLNWDSAGAPDDLLNWDNLNGASVSDVTVKVTSQQANISALITDVFFNFGNNAGASRYQDFGIGDISFPPLPEINPNATAAGSCLAAFGLTVLARRAKVRAGRLNSAQS